MENTRDPLLPYKTKRDFTVTPEPGVNPEPHNFKEKSVLSFVVQKHDARSLHYDFRLELDGVLKSWAVPKGPSLDPKQKRLAVNVEDHPLEYAQFEGEIPPEQYGAGTVSIWDHGTWEPTGDPHEGLEKGDLKFTLHGEKLKGIWVLIHIRNKAGKKQNTWLLVKERDSFAQLKTGMDPADPPIPEGALKGFVPSVISPQMATLKDRIPSGDEWTFEIKLDGYRMMTRIFDDGITIFTRNGINWTTKLRSIAESLKELKITPGWVDGEIVYPGKDGLPDFGALQQAFDSKNENGIIYYLFDMPFYNGYDLRNTGLSERRSLLKNVLSRSASISDRIKFSENFDAGGGDILDSACRLGLEGIMGKRKDSHYMSGRSQSWVKIKCSQRQEFVLVGFTKNKNSDRDISSLLLGVYDENGHLRYAGRVGTGFNHENAKDIGNRLSKIISEKTPLYDKPKDASGIWVLPELVAEISFAEWTKEGRVRQAVFHGLRTDKSANTVVREKIREVPDETSDESAGEAETRIKTDRKDLVIDSPKSLTKKNPGKNISNPERIVDPSSGTRKIDIIEYYQFAADRILPHLENRPVAFLRAPSGIGGTLFFQKHAQTLRIPELNELAKELDPEHQPLMNIGSVTALIGAAQMNVIEFHTWNFTTKDAQKPDRIVFDLDPGEGLEWKKMLEAVRLTKTLLDKLGLKSFLKTSGGKGLHIVVPLMPHDDWETVKNFSKAVSSHMAKVIPEMFSDISGEKNRIGKIFIDYIRNNFGSTTVSAYSVRARPGMGISIPCSWERILELTGGAHWSVSNIREYLASADDPWKDYFKTKQIISEEAKEIFSS